jgi:AcrR family transcriptional regulator
VQKDRNIMAPKPDRRVERTRAALKAAFVEIMLSRGYAEATVEAITARANIGRSTFYMHYKNREDLLLESLQRPSTLLAAIVGDNPGAERLVPQLEHFREQRRLNKVFFESPAKDIWIKCLASMIEPRLVALSRKAAGRPALPLGLIAVHIAQAQIALVTTWLLQWPQLRAPAVANALIDTTNANVAALLRMPSAV